MNKTIGEDPVRIQRKPKPGISTEEILWREFAIEWLEELRTGKLLLVLWSRKEMGVGCPDGQHVGVETMKNDWWELGPWREPLKVPPQAQWGALLPSSKPPVSSSDTYWPNLNGSWWARELGKCNMQRLALQRAEQGKDGEWIRDPRGEWPL